MGPVLTVVIAAKDPSPHLLRLCLSSFGRLSLAPKIQILIVASGSIPPIDHNLETSFHSLTVEFMPPQGVYAAYNCGIINAVGSFICFFGVDDIALPGFDDVLQDLEMHVSKPVALVAAQSYMQNIGISKPSRWRASILFRNWCHQGLIYSRDYLRKNHFNVNYFAQADHDLNIRILADMSLQVVFRPELIAYFSSGGVSQARHDLEFRKVLPQIADKTFGLHYGLLVRAKQLLADLIKGRRKNDEFQ
jgi:glycosyltransferase involved in cell wall biosynthesis